MTRRAERGSFGPAFPLRDGSLPDPSVLPELHPLLTPIHPRFCEFGKKCEIFGEKLRFDEIFVFGFCYGYTYIRRVKLHLTRTIGRYRGILLQL